MDSIRSLHSMHADGGILSHQKWAAEQGASASSSVWVKGVSTARTHA